MGQALYRKYRSKSLDEVIGQEHITTTLKNALKSGKISHAYLFTGPRGVGKTSVARILAHEVNQIPYADDNAHLDIIEIDAASNRRIDEIRDLRDKVHIAPTSGKYKVYIIDEVHMLTKEAFNALLKTLEEPPKHVIFILATTEAYKLPETIISRTQRHTFKPIEADKVVEHLKTIAKLEKIDIDDAALDLIAEHGEGSFRDSISLLDQARSISNNKVTAESVREALGMASESAIDAVFGALASKDSAALLNTIETLFTQGYQPAKLARQISERLRSGIINNDSTLDYDTTLALIRELISVPASPNPARLIEVILLSSVINTSESSPKIKPTADIKPPDAQTATTKVAKLPHNENRKITKSKSLTIESWTQALEIIKSRHNTLYSLLRMAVPSIDKNILTLSFQFPFHQKRVNEDKNSRLIRDILGDLTESEFELVTVLDVDQKVKTKNLPQQESKSNIETISNIFGGAEMLES